MSDHFKSLCAGDYRFEKWVSEMSPTRGREPLTSSVVRECVSHSIVAIRRYVFISISIYICTDYENRKSLRHRMLHRSHRAAIKPDDNRRESCRSVFLAIYQHNFAAISSRFKLLHTSTAHCTLLCMKTSRCWCKDSPQINTYLATYTSVSSLTSLPGSRFSSHSHFHCCHSTSPHSLWRMYVNKRPAVIEVWQALFIFIHYFSFCLEQLLLLLLLSSTYCLNISNIVLNGFRNICHQPVAHSYRYGSVYTQWVRQQSVILCRLDCGVQIYISPFWSDSVIAV